METLVAAAVLGPMVSVVTAYNAWAVYRACKDRYFPEGESPAANAERTAALAPWLEHYNTHRRHSAIGGQPPINRLTPT